jgi:hypothetical protein
MKQAILGIVLVSALATPAWAGCAWVLWIHAVGVGPSEQRVGPKLEESWDAVDAYETKTECSKQVQVQVKEEEKRKEVQRQEKEKLSVAFFDYRCLPDTVDPRAPKPSR